MKIGTVLVAAAAGLVATIVALPIMLWMAAGDSQAACIPQPGLSPNASAPPSGALPKIDGLDKEQMGNAAIIVAVGRQMKVPQKGLIVAIATARTESRLYNLDYGHATSLGLFQQQKWWGTREERTHPPTASKLFYQALLKVAGWQKMSVTNASHAVQKSAFPERVTQHEDLARRVVTALLGSDASPEVLPDACLDTPPGNKNPDGSWPPEPQTGSDRLTARTRAVRDAIKAQFDPPHGIGCYRAVEDGGEHPRGRACDFMLAPGRMPTSKNRQLGDAIAAWAQQTADQTGVMYIIWKQRIWSVERADEGWRTMEDRGSITQNHFDHVHISVY